MREVENTISNRPSPQEMERRLNVLAYAKTLPQAKNIVKLRQGKSYDFDELKRISEKAKNKKYKSKNN